MSFVIPKYRFRRDWEGHTAVIIGNGPSVEGLDLSILDRSDLRIMVTNGGYRTYPAAHMLMCSDRHWLAAQTTFEGYTGPQIVTTQPQAVKVPDKRIVQVGRMFVERPEASQTMESNPAVLVEGHTSVSTCISAAIHRGVARILLLGLDLKPGPGGKRRAHEAAKDEPAAAKFRYDKQARHFTMQSRIVRKLGVEVINCSPPSRLSCYPMADLAEVLK